MRRFFITAPSLNQEEITLPIEEAKHIFKVLRMKEGDTLEIINGLGEIIIGEIITCQPKVVVVKKISTNKYAPESHHIHIAIAPTKHIDRFEWFLEKSTELGVHEITPLLCANSERTQIKLDRSQKIIIAALKQSKRLFLPKLNPLTSFDTFVKENPKGLIAHCYEDMARDTNIQQQLIADRVRWTAENFPILIGPEGDFNTKEVQFALENGYQAVTLGKTRLRTETAGLYACMNLKSFFEAQ